MSIAAQYHQMGVHSLPGILLAGDDTPRSARPAAAVGPAEACGARRPVALCRPLRERRLVRETTAPGLITAPGAMPDAQWHGMRAASILGGLDVCMECCRASANAECCTHTVWQQWASQA